MKVASTWYDFRYCYRPTSHRQATASATRVLSRSELAMVVQSLVLSRTVSLSVAGNAPQLHFSLPEILLHYSVTALPL